MQPQHRPTPRARLGNPPKALPDNTLGISTQIEVL